jgi:hypothetical protein
MFAMPFTANRAYPANQDKGGHKNEKTGYKT